MKRNDSRSFGPKYEHPHSCRALFDENANRCFSQRPEVKTKNKIKTKYRKQIQTDTIAVYTFGTCSWLAILWRYNDCGKYEAGWERWDVRIAIPLDFFFFVYLWFIHKQFIIHGRIDDPLLMTFSNISIKGHRVIFTHTGLGLFNILYVR